MLSNLGNAPDVLLNEKQAGQNSVHSVPLMRESGS